MKLKKAIFFGMIIISFLLISCQTIDSRPRIFNVSPSVYESEDVEISYSIGLKIYYICIYNKTNDDILIDWPHASIVSIGGQTKSLNLKAEDNYIPAKSKLILSSYQDTFFNENIEDGFKGSTIEDKGKVVVNIRENEALLGLFENNKSNTDSYSNSYNNIDELSILKSMLGKKIRLIIPIRIRNIEQKYDIVIIIDSIK